MKRNQLVAGRTTEVGPASWKVKPESADRCPPMFHPLEDAWQLNTDGHQLPTLQMHGNAIILPKELLFLRNFIFKPPAGSSTYDPSGNLTTHQPSPLQVGSVTVRVTDRDN